MTRAMDEFLPSIGGTRSDLNSFVRIRLIHLYEATINHVNLISLGDIMAGYLNHHVVTI